MRRWLPLLFVMATSGCLEKMLMDGQIEATRKALPSMDGTADFEVARDASGAGLGQFEGLHWLAPENEDGYYLLVKGYASHAFAFVEDEMEAAIVDGKEDLADYHRLRAKSLYTRAIGFGEEWLEKKHRGFVAARSSGHEKQMVAYLSQFGRKADAPMLFWIGYSWLARVNVAKDDNGLIGTLYVGRAMMDRVVALDESLEMWSPHVVLGAYDARTGWETLGDASFASSKAHFDKADRAMKGQVLLTPVTMALSYACYLKDASPGRRESLALYRKLLQGVVGASDTLPESRLMNAIAKRRARRYLSARWMEEKMREDCGWDLGG